MDRVLANRDALAILDDLVCRLPELKICQVSIMQAYELMAKSFSSGGKMLVCGNGGSAADSDHIVGELMKSFRFKRGVSEAFAERYLSANGEAAPMWLADALPAINLASQEALLTAHINDEGSTGVFAQQVYGYGLAGDLLFALSTSGESGNVVEAVKVARALGMSTVALTGNCESSLSRLSDVSIKAPSSLTFEIQEMHLPIYHCICAMLEAAFFENHDI